MIKIKLGVAVSVLYSITTGMLSFSTTALEKREVYVQASAGSFNDAAINQLFAQQSALKMPVNFAGTPSHTFEQADNTNTWAFSAVENSTIPGKLVDATITAVQQYRIVDVIGFITTPIEMCALMHIDDVNNNKEISVIASHPAALKQIKGWKAKVGVPELAVPNGTSAAAERVSKRLLGIGGVAVGSCVLVETYPNLSVIAKGIQDNKHNETSFLLMKVNKRTEMITINQARKALSHAITLGRAL
ncbi:prephenate dehydratase domain-containing protein [Pseudoalteromonas aurantia]|uniref:prephenate dehydratase n=1 Tax=Pseudoalteromonas aurantia 208 TaxID=1314867 RepID=A0ABR9ECE7_9GAMM|nr:prephenate dehydratase domain-containing protein [Pseudoalteromonas aurantia]MBE0368635.1 hypothetical protein [Pseudoalteromonas aurantia 208]